MTQMGSDTQTMVMAPGRMRMGTSIQNKGFVRYDAYSNDIISEEVLYMTYNLVEIQKRQESTDKFVQKVGKTLWHYTSFPALDGILGKKKDLVWQRNECE